MLAIKAQFGIEILVVSVLYIQLALCMSDDNAVYLLLSGSYGLLLLISLAIFGLQIGGNLRAVLPILTLGALCIGISISSIYMYFDGPSRQIWSLVYRSPTQSIDRSKTVIEVIKLSGIFCAFAIGYLIGQRRRLRNDFLNIFVAAGGLYSFWAFFSFVMLPNTIMGFSTKELFPDRLTGSFPSPNIAGAYFGISIPLTILLITQRKLDRSTARRSSLEHQVVGLAFPCSVAIVQVTALILTSSRGAILISLFNLAAFAAFELQASKTIAKKNQIFVVFPVMALLILLLVLSGSHFFERLAAIGDQNMGRPEIYQAHGFAIRANPVSGYGIGTFDRLNTKLLSPTNLPALWNVRSMHSAPLQWVEGAGIIGAAPIFLTIAFLIFRKLSYLVFDRGENSSFVRGILTAAITELLCSAVDFSLEIPAIAGLFALLLGCGFSASFPHRHADSRLLKNA